MPIRRSNVDHLPSLPSLVEASVAPFQPLFPSRQATDQFGPAGTENALPASTAIGARSKTSPRTAAAVSFQPIFPSFPGARAVGGRCVYRRRRSCASRTSSVLHGPCVARRGSWTALFACDSSGGRRLRPCVCDGKETRLGPGLRGGGRKSSGGPAEDKAGSVRLRWGRSAGAGRPTVTGVDRFPRPLVRPGTPHIRWLKGLARGSSESRHIAERLPGRDPMVVRIHHLATHSILPLHRGACS